MEVGQNACISMVIDKKGSRNVAAKAGKMSEAVLDSQANFVIVTPEVKGQDFSSEHESLDDEDVESNTGLVLTLISL